MSRKTEIQVGITVIAALAILVFGVSWLRDLSLARKVRLWTVTFPQTGGLAASDEVQINGIPKGAVQSMELAGNHVVVKLALAQEVALTTDSRVSIRNVGLMGEKVIAVDLEPSGRKLSERDTIPGLYEKGVPEVMAELGNSVGAVSSVAAQMQKLADALEKHGDFERTVQNLNETTEQLKLTVLENRSTLKRTLDDASSAAATARGLTTGKEAELSRALDNFSQAAQNMNRLTVRLDSLRTTLQSLSGKLDHGDGTLGKLVNEDSLYVSVRASVQSLNALIDDVKKNPKRYIHVSVF